MCRNNTRESRNNTRESGNNTHGRREAGTPMDVGRLVHPWDAREAGTLMGCREACTP